MNMIAALIASEVQNQADAQVFEQIINRCQRAADLFTVGKVRGAEVASAFWITEQRAIHMSLGGLERSSCL